jgi:hypothetical protein
MFNSSMISNTREWLFHHTKDAALVPYDLPKPSDRDMTDDALPDVRKVNSP